MRNHRTSPFPGHLTLVPDDHPGLAPDLADAPRIPRSCIVLEGAPALDDGALAGHIVRSVTSTGAATTLLERQLPAGTQPGSWPVLVVALRDTEGGSFIPFVAAVRRRWPSLPVVAWTGVGGSWGRDVLLAARSGVQHLAFAGVDALSEVVFSLPPSEYVARAPEERKRVRASGDKPRPHGEAPSSG
ncbi:MAG: hypothetical protein JWO05_164 [Gemmatimonadetes bacterium]|nr:hypothetical protein [Gemmatimonadota bacterium]